MRHRVDDGRPARRAALGSRASPRRCRAHAHAARPNGWLDSVRERGKCGKAVRSATRCLLGDPRRWCGAPAYRVRPRARGRRHAGNRPPEGLGACRRERARRLLARGSARLVVDFVQIESASRMGLPARSSSRRAALTPRASPRSEAHCLVGRSPAKIVESKRPGGRPWIRLDREVERGSAIEIGAPPRSSATGRRRALRLPAHRPRGAGGGRSARARR